MAWGFLTPQHIITIILTFIVAIAIPLILSRVESKISDRVLFILSLFGIAGVIGNLIIGIQEGIFLKKLPLHLCSYNALLLPIAVKTKNNKLCTTLSVWSIGALIAILLNEEAVGYVLMGPKFLIYYIPHVFEFSVPLAMLFLNKFNTKLKDCIWAVSFTAVMYTFSYAISEVIISTGTDVNYLFGVGPTNFVTEFFYSILPYKYLYMFTTFPIIVILYLLVYLKQRVSTKKREKDKIEFYYWRTKYEENLFGE